MFAPSVLHVSRLMKKREQPVRAGEQSSQLCFETVMKLLNTKFVVE